MTRITLDCVELSYSLRSADARGCCRFTARQSPDEARSLSDEQKSLISKIGLGETRMAKPLGFSRRSLLGFGATVGLCGLSGIMSPGALAKAPFLNSQAPTFFRFKLGSAEATIISDGVLPLGDPHAAFLGISAGDLDS